MKSVRIRNFRCLQDCQVEFDSLTTFVGPNGAGKSTILRALDWFFNGEPTLSSEDIYSGARDDCQVSVEVSFVDLTASDRAALGPKYAPPDSPHFTAWRVWGDGTDKMTARARSFPQFERIRATHAAREKRQLWEALQHDAPDLNLPRWSNVDAIESEMARWELENPDRLEETESGVTHLFGFNGQNKLSGLFDFVLVTADLRASEESQDNRRTIVGRILEKSIDRSSANTEFEQLAAEVSARQEAIREQHLGPQLAGLAQALTDEVSMFAAGRQVALHAISPDIRPSQASVRIAIGDASTETSIERQGHGFQRALLIAALKLLASQRPQGAEDSVICLAIEEPELFQHPAQSKVFAHALRKLSTDATGGFQITYATHSPYFIDARYFDQVRRVCRSSVVAGGHPKVEVFRASLESVSLRLSGVCTDQAIRSRWHQVCTRNLAEAFFAQSVILVEGDCDRAILEGAAARSNRRSFEIHGVTVSEAGGKSHLFTPHAIMSELGIPVLVVFDNDSGRGQRVQARIDAGGQGDPARETAAAAAENRSILRYLGIVESDFPIGNQGAAAFAWDDTLEHVLQRDWPSWEEKRKELVRDGRGVAGRDGKHAPTYGLAAEECDDEPGGLIADLLSAIQALDPTSDARGV